MYVCSYHGEMSIEGWGEGGGGGKGYSGAVLGRQKSYKNKR